MVPCNSQSSRFEKNRKLKIDRIASGNSPSLDGNAGTFFCVDVTIATVLTLTAVALRRRFTLYLVSSLGLLMPLCCDQPETLAHGHY